MAEVEFHPVLKTPFERDLVDCPSALALVHGRMIVPWRVEMGAIVRRELHALDGPSLPVRQILLLEPGKERQDLRQTLLMIDVLDRGPKSRRVGWDVVLQRRGNSINRRAIVFSTKIESALGRASAFSALSRVCMAPVMTNGKAEGPDAGSLDRPFQTRRGPRAVRCAGRRGSAAGKARVRIRPASQVGETPRKTKRARDGDCGEDRRPPEIHRRRTDRPIA